VHLSAPALAAAADGRLFAAWIRSDGEVGHIYVDSVGDATPAVRVDPPDLVVDSAHQAPGLAIGSAGEIYVSWSSRRPRSAAAPFASDVRLSTSRDGGHSFDPPLRVNADQPASHAFEGIASDAEGALLVAWIDDRDGPGRAGIFAARVVESGTRVESEQRLSASACVCCRVDVATGPERAAAVLWREELPAEVRDMQLASSRDAGRSYAPPELVHADGWVLQACPHRGGQIGVGPLGERISVWYTEGRDERPALRIARAGASGPFGTPLALHLADGSIPDHADLAIRSDGAGLVAWEAQTAARRRVLARVISVRGELGAARALSSAVQAFEPAVTATPAGFAVAWHENAFPTTRTVVQRFRLGGR
jgi:hypothetical protein